MWAFYPVPLVFMPDPAKPEVTHQIIERVPIDPDARKPTGWSRFLGQGKIETDTCLGKGSAECVFPIPVSAENEHDGGAAAVNEVCAKWAACLESQRERIEKQIKQAALKEMLETGAKPPPQPPRLAL